MRRTTLTATATMTALAMIVGFATAAAAVEAQSPSTSRLIKQDETSRTWLKINTDTGVNADIVGLNMSEQVADQGDAGFTTYQDLTQQNAPQRVATPQRKALSGESAQIPSRAPLADMVSSTANVGTTVDTYTGMTTRR